MSEIDPPVQLDDASNSPSKDYLLSTAAELDFDYPQVTTDARLLNCYFWTIYTIIGR